MTQFRSNAEPAWAAQLSMEPSSALSCVRADGSLAMLCYNYIILYYNFALSLCPFGVAESCSHRRKGETPFISTSFAPFYPL